MFYNKNIHLVNILLLYRKQKLLQFTKLKQINGAKSKRYKSENSQQNYFVFILMQITFFACTFF